MFYETVRDLIAKLSALIGLIQGNECDCLAKVSGLRHLKFVDVIYDDFQGIKRPIGLIHEIKMPNGERREVFTFCCRGAKQPEMALFVKRRTGNLSDEMSLTFDGQDMIPTFLKSLPSDYRDTYMLASPQRMAA